MLSCLIIQKRIIFNIFYIITAPLSLQSVPNALFSMKPLPPKYKMCCDWSAGPLCCNRGVQIWCHFVSGGGSTESQ